LTFVKIVRQPPFLAGFYPLPTQLWTVLAVILAGFLLRVYRLDHQSLWYDEAFSLTLSRLAPGPMTSALIRDFVHPPLHYYLLHVWLELFGYGAFQARLLSAVFGTLAITMTYLWARYLFDHQTALLAAILLAVSQLGVMYSQEARPYAQLLFLVLCSSYLFIVALRERRALAWWGFVGSAVLAMYTHYHGVLAIGALLLFAAIYHKRYPLPRYWLIGGGLLSLVLYAPWLLSGVVGEALSSAKTLPDAQPSWFTAHWWTLLSIINSFNNGRLFGFFASSPWWVFLVGGVLFTLPALMAFTPLNAASGAGSGERLQRESLVLPALLWLLPMLVVFGLGVTMDVQYDVRYVAFCAAPYYILVARGIFQLNAPSARRFFALGILLFSVSALRANFLVPYKENYRDALAYLARHYQAGDYCLFVPHGVPLQWSIYHGNYPPLHDTDLATVLSDPAKFNRLWLVTYRRTVGATRKVDETKHKIEATHFIKDEQHHFWVDVYLYMAKRSLGAQSQSVEPIATLGHPPSDGHAAPSN
jgi:4-amino-4-deoxy-L-arabinose transferase-like glycosyltransferase